jgi:hypothetical protein
LLGSGAFGGRLFHLGLDILTFPAPGHALIVPWDRRIN